jgi:hypothetical protein
MNESLPRERSKYFGHEHRRVALFLDQPEGLPLYVRPASLEIAFVGPPHFASPASLGEHTAAAGPAQIV